MNWIEGIELNEWENEWALQTSKVRFKDFRIKGTKWLIIKALFCSIHYAESKYYLRRKKRSSRFNQLSAFAKSDSVEIHDRKKLEQKIYLTLQSASH